MTKKVLVVDDSVLMRRLIGDIVNETDGFTVIDEAKDGIEAIDKFRYHKPDILTLDIEMPKLNGLLCLERIMKIRPVPVIILSAYSKEGSKISLRALELGAFEIIEKPSGSVSLDMEIKADEIRRKLNSAVKVNMNTLLESTTQFKEISSKIRPVKKAQRLVAIACSTGGPKTLMEIIPKISMEIKAGLAIVQHMPAGFTGSFAERLNAISMLNVYEAYDGAVLNEGECVIAKGGRHMVFDDGGIIRLDDSPSYHSVKPSADIMMLSAVKYFQKHILGVVLTGMGKDGTEGIEMIKLSGGRNIAETEESAIIYGMPKSAFKTGKVDYECGKHEMAKKIEETLNGMERV